MTILFKVGEVRVEILRILYGGQKIEPVLEKCWEISAPVRSAEDAGKEGYLASLSSEAVYDVDLGVEELNLF